MTPHGLRLGITIAICAIVALMLIGALWFTAGSLATSNLSRATIGLAFLLMLGFYVVKALSVYRAQRA